MERTLKPLKRTILLMTLAALAGGIARPAEAACGRDKVPAWSDIDAIRYARTNCFGKCPSYEVLFSKGGFYYVGRRYAPNQGTLEAPYSAEGFERAISVLRENRFFALNYDSSRFITDVAHDIISVERCGVTTRLDWPNLGDRPDIESLLKMLDAITATIHWKKTSDSEDSPVPILAPALP